MTLPAEALTFYCPTMEPSTSGEILPSITSNTNAAHLAQWTGSVWNNFGAAGTFNGGVSAITLLNTVLYAGGAFSFPRNNAAYYTGTTWDNINGSDFAQPVLAMLSLDNNIYIGGKFTQYNTAGTPTTVGHIVKFKNGSPFDDMSGGTDGNVTALVVAPALILSSVG